MTSFGYAFQVGRSFYTETAIVM